MIKTIIICLNLLKTKPKSAEINVINCMYRVKTKPAAGRVIMISQ